MKTLEAFQSLKARRGLMAWVENFHELVKLSFIQSIEHLVASVVYSLVNIQEHFHYF